MKTVKYKSELYSVPKWVNYIATDKNALIMGYENKPILQDDHFLPNGGRWEFIDSMEWENSLEKV